MSARELYEGLLIELNKDNAPNILLEEFNYFANKAVNNYINKKYNIYDINQQSSDDLRVLKATAKLTPTKIYDYSDLSLAGGANYEIVMPSDYLHLLNCICIYKVNKTFKCYNAGDTWRAAAKRLTADMYSQVLDNFWNKPSYKNPYYYIHNINLYKQNMSDSNNLPPTNPMTSAGGKGTDASVIITNAPDISDGEYLELSGESLGLDAFGVNIGTGLNYVNSINFKDGNYSLRERGAELRYGNRSEVRIEIRYGTDDSIFELTKVYVDYIKAPQHIRLTQQQIDFTLDTSQLLEYPDYVCQEILNELVNLIMENISDLRLSTHPVVSLSIANPTQALTPETAG